MPLFEALISQQAIRPKGLDTAEFTYLDTPYTVRAARMFCQGEGLSDATRSDSFEIMGNSCCTTWNRMSG